MCGVYRDENSVIQNGDMIVPLQFPPILWSDFLNDTEKSLALRELVYILERQDVTDDKSRFLYRSIFRHLVVENKSNPDNGNYPIELNELVTTIPEEVRLQTTGVIIEAAMFFSLFFLCKQLAGATGYANTNSEFENYALTVDGEKLDDIFSLSTTTNIIKKRLNGETNVDTINIKSSKYHAYNLLYPLLDDIESSDFKYLNILNPLIYEGDVWRLGEQSIESVKDIVLNLFNDDLGKAKEYYRQKIIKNEDNKDSFNLAKERLIKCHMEEFYRLLQKKAKDETIPNLLLKAFVVGDGSDTIGLLGIQNLGTILFSYDYQENMCVKRDATIDIGRVKKNSVVHISIWGMNQDYDSEDRCITLSGNTLQHKWTMEFENHSESKYRIKRESFKTIPNRYVSSVNSEVIQHLDCFSDFSDTLFIHNNRVIAVYKSTSKDLFFYEDCENVKFYVDGKGDEIFGFICVSENKNAHDYYEPDKFELTKAQIDVVLDDAMCELLLKKIKNGYRIKPDLEGDFVGKIPENTLTDSGYRNPENLVTDSEYNTMGSSKESGDPKYEQSTLRHSSLEMTEEKINGIDMVKLKITSHVSPRISRLDKYLNESQKQQYRIENYTVMSSDGEIYSYNPLLAVLRSMGFLEAIVKKLYQYNLNNGYNIDKHEFSEILNNARSFDKNATNRGLPDIYQISDPITYDIYNSMKWYKGDEDRYDHSINFNEN